MNKNYGSIKFTASNGEEYEIRHTADTSRIEMRVFKDNLRVSRLCYSTTFQTADEFAFATGGNVVDELVRKAKSDVESQLSLG